MWLPAHCQFISHIAVFSHSVSTLEFYTFDGRRHKVEKGEFYTFLYSVSSAITKQLAIATYQCRPFVRLFVFGTSCCEGGMPPAADKRKNRRKHIGPYQLSLIHI